MDTTNTLMNKKRPHVASDQKPRMRGGEETTNHLEPSRSSLPALAHRGADIWRKAIGWIRVKVRPQIVRRDLVIDSSADRDDVFAWHAVSSRIKPVPDVRLLHRAIANQAQFIGQRLLSGCNFNCFFEG